LTLISSTTLRQGILYVFPSQQPYSIAHDPDRPIDCLWMHADVFPYVVHRLLEVDPAAYPDIGDTLRLLGRQIEGGSAAAHCAVVFGLALLELMIGCGILDRRVESTVLDLDDVNPADTVRSLSGRSGYTPEHFIRAFTRETGMTPYQYILGQRMNEAVALMHRGMMLDDIAARVGYASGKSFAGAFKRRFGISPDTYRAYFLRRA